MKAKKISDIIKDQQINEWGAGYAVYGGGGGFGNPSQGGRFYGRGFGFGQGSSNGGPNLMYTYAIKPLNATLQQAGTPQGNERYFHIGNTIKGYIVGTKTKVSGQIIKIEENSDRDVLYYQIIDDSGMKRKIDPTSAKLIHREQTVENNMRDILGENFYPSLKDFLNENTQQSIKIKPIYFDLPYQVPEDRFENGLLKSNISRRSNFKTKIKLDYSNLKYKNVDDFFKNANFKEIENQVKNDIKKVTQFINNNPLTGKLLKVKFEKTNDIKNSIENFLQNTSTDGDFDSGLSYGYIFPFFNDCMITVDYDLYKGCTVFTFSGDSLIYYFTVFTLEKNDVDSAGEDATFITTNELLQYILFETIIRVYIQTSIDNGIDLNDNFINKLSAKIKKMLLEDNADMLNWDYKVTHNYFDKEIIKNIREFINNDFYFDETDEDETDEDDQDCNAGFIFMNGEYHSKICVYNKNSYLIRKPEFKWDGTRWIENENS